MKYFHQQIVPSFFFHTTRVIEIGIQIKIIYIYIYILDVLAFYISIIESVMRACRLIETKWLPTKKGNEQMISCGNYF